MTEHGPTNFSGIVTGKKLMLSSYIIVGMNPVHGRTALSKIVTKRPTLEGTDWFDFTKNELNAKDVQVYGLDGSCPLKGGYHMFFSEELAGPGGMNFTLFREPGHTDEDEKEAKDYLRGSRDVVKLFVKKVVYR